MFFKHCIYIAFENNCNNLCPDFKQGVSTLKGNIIMKLISLLLFFVAVIISNLTAAQTVIHVWEKQELTFTAANTYRNPYAGDVTIWVDLKGPGFNKRVYGFWDGGQIFHLRIVATKAGEWTWTSGSSPEDPGLSGKSGSFTAVDWDRSRKR